MTASLECVLAVVIALSSIPLMMLSIRLYKTLSLVEARLDPALGFFLLGLGQLAGALGILADGRLAYTLYVATSYLEATGFIALIQGVKKGTASLYTILPLTVPLAGDALAAASSFYASYRFHSLARILALSIGMAFTVRLMGLLLAPSTLGTLLLVVGELTRASSLAALSLVYGKP